MAAAWRRRRTRAPGTRRGVGVTPRGGARRAAPRKPQPLRQAAAGGPAAGLAAGTASRAGGRRRLGEAAAVLDAAAELPRRAPAMASAARSLAARAADLAGGRFTLALFGAFSAGKSSFANALLGEEVLPVSPHPATAAVGRIFAPAGDFCYASAVVTMQSREDVWQDLLHSFSVLQLAVPRPQT
ncbi:hypothetical protein AMQ83_12875, partial [Paenibacillus riograndensis]